jgi:hypothetical protein
MPKRKAVDPEKLIKAVQSGKPSTEIMKEFGIKTSAQLKSKYLDAMVETGAVKGIAGTRGRGKRTDKSKIIRVNKRGSLVIPSEMVGSMGFKEGEGFAVWKIVAGVSLKKS